MKNKQDETIAGAGVAVFVFLAGLWWAASLFQQQRPEVLSADSPASNFSAQRVLVDVGTVVECGVRMVGSRNLACASHRIESILRNISAHAPDLVDVEQQKTAPGSFSLPFLEGVTLVYDEMTNLVVRYQSVAQRMTTVDTAIEDDGEKCVRPRAVLLSAHFDSTIGSPAASDDTAQIGIMIELLRNLVATREDLGVDIMFNFNGGEELLLAAAHGFISHHRWAKHLCAVINLESTGVGGWPVLINLSPKHAWLADVVSAAPYQVSSSFAPALFNTGVLPGDTDFTVYRDFGDLPGMDWAIIGGGHVYHSGMDDMKNLRQDPGSLQIYGENIAAVLRALTARVAVSRPIDEPLAAQKPVFMSARWAGKGFFLSLPLDVARALYIGLAGLIIGGAFLHVPYHELLRALGRGLSRAACTVLFPLFVALTIAACRRPLAFYRRQGLATLVYAAASLAGFTMHERKAEQPLVELFGRATMILFVAGHPLSCQAAFSEFIVLAIFGGAMFLRPLVSSLRVQFAIDLAACTPVLMTLLTAMNLWNYVFCLQARLGPVIAHVLIPIVAGILMLPVLAGVGPALRLVQLRSLRAIRWVAAAFALGGTVLVLFDPEPCFGGEHRQRVYVQHEMRDWWDATDTSVRHLDNSSTVSVLPADGWAWASDIAAVPAFSFLDHLGARAPPGKMAPHPVVYTRGSLAFPVNFVYNYMWPEWSAPYHELPDLTISFSRLGERTVRLLVQSPEPCYAIIYLSGNVAEWKLNASLPKIRPDCAAQNGCRALLLQSDAKAPRWVVDLVLDEPQRLAAEIIVSYVDLPHHPSPTQVEIARSFPTWATILPSTVRMQSWRYEANGAF